MHSFLRPFSLLLLALLCVSTPVFAATRMVNGTGISSNSGCISGTTSNHTTIAAAVSAASGGDVIIVCKNGNQPYKENVVINKAISIYGNESGVLVNASNASFPVFNITAASVTIANFSLRDANDTSAPMAAGIYVAASSATIYNVTVVHNKFGILSYLNQNVNITGSSAINNSDSGFLLNVSSNGTLLNNTAYGQGTAGFKLVNSSNDSLSSNQAYNNSFYGFLLFTSAFNHTLMQNNGTSNSYGFYLTGAQYINLTNNSAVNNSIYGIWLETSSNNTLINNTAIRNLQGGFVVTSSSLNNSLVNNSGADNSLFDFYITSCDNTVTQAIGSGNRPANFTNSSVNWSNLNVSELDLCNADGSNLTNISVRGSDLISNDGLMLAFADNVTINNSQSSDNYAGFYLLSSLDNKLVNNTAINSSAYGFYVDSNGNAFRNNTAINNTDYGFYISASNSFLSNNTAYNTSQYGFFISGANNNLTNNTAAGNTKYGFYVAGTNVLSNNTAYSQPLYGFYLTGADSSNLTGNTAYSNRLAGLYITDSSGVLLRTEHYYNNSLDFLMNSTGNLGINFPVNLSGVVFDNPAGNFQNYTNLSMYDSVADTSVYAFNWSAQPAALPGNTISFTGKFLNITAISGTVSLDTVVWHWGDNDLPGAYDEARFELWKYNQSGWFQVNRTPNTATNTFQISSLNSFSVFGILQNDSVNGCTVLTGPGVYNMSGNIQGAPFSSTPVGGTSCVKISASHVDFSCNGFSIANNGTTGFTSGILLNTSLTNVTVRNCPAVSNFTYGVYVYQSNGSAILNSSVSNNSNAGFVLNNSNAVNFSLANAENSTASWVSGGAAGFYVENSTGINLSFVTVFNSTSAYVFVNRSSATFAAVARAIRIPSGGLDIYAGSGSNISTTLGSLNSNFTSDKINLTFTDMENLTMYLPFLSSTGLDPTRCGSSTYSFCGLVSEPINFIDLGSGRLGSLTIYYNASKISGALSGDSIQLGHWGDAGWSAVGRSALDTQAHSVTYGPLTSFSFWGAVSFLAASNSISGGSGSPAALNLSAPVFGCPDNTITFMLNSGGSTPVANVRIRLLDAQTNSMVAEQSTDAHGQVLFTLSSAGDYRTSTHVPSGYLQPSEKQFHFVPCTPPSGETLPAPTPAPSPPPESQPPSSSSSPPPATPPIAPLPVPPPPPPSSCTITSSADTVQVGERVQLSVACDGAPAADRSIELTDPHGNPVVLHTDSNGRAAFSADFRGEYTASLVTTGAEAAVKSISIQAFIRPPASSPFAIPTILLQDPVRVLLLAAVVLLLVAVFIYHRLHSVPRKKRETF